MIRKPLTSLRLESGFSRQNIFWPIVLLLPLALMGWMAFSSVESEFKEILKEQLHSNLKVNVQSFLNWANDKKSDIKVLSAQPEVRKNLLALIQQGQLKEANSENLSQSPELSWLRQHLGPLCREYGFIGFVVLDATGLQVGALLQDPIGKRALMERSNFFDRSMLGLTVVSSPFSAETALPNIKGEMRKEAPTMFISTPIRDKNEEIVGVLAFRDRPRLGFSRILEVGRFGHSGETYAFNREGFMLSDSRFDDQLRQLGLIPNTPRSSSILENQVRDPGANMLKGLRSVLPRDQHPLTFAAQNAIDGQAGENLQGYNDYRGVAVVGAWTWLQDFDFGVVTEIDIEEAYAPLKTLDYWLFLIFALLLGATGVASVFRRQQLHLESERKNDFARLQDSEAKIRAVMGGAQEGIVTIDSKGKIETFNRAAEDMFGYLASEVVGLNVKLLMPATDRDNHDNYIQRYLRTGEAQIIGIGREVIGLRKDDSCFHLMLRISNVFLGGERHFVGTLTDITDRKQIEMEQQRLMRQIKTANQDLQQFAFVVSHDLKAPLRGIRHVAQWMEDEIAGKASAKVDGYLGKIKSRVKKMVDMIDGILEYSQAGQDLPGQLRIINIDKFLHDVLDVLAFPEGVTVEVMPEMPTLETNPTKLNQVFTNLIVNAAKYRNQVDCQIKIGWKNKGAFYEFSVADNGPGIPLKDQDRIFGVFQSINTNPEVEGFGVGLAIVKKIVVAQGGSLSLESKLGEGSTFSFLLPKDAPK